MTKATKPKPERQVSKDFQFAPNYMFVMGDRRLVVTKVTLTHGLFGSTAHMDAIFWNTGDVNPTTRLQLGSQAQIVSGVHITQPVDLVLIAVTVIESEPEAGEPVGQSKNGACLIWEDVLTAQRRKDDELTRRDIARKTLGYLSSDEGGAH